MLERGVAGLMLASFFQGARCARPYLQDFVHPFVGRARRAPSHRGRWWRPWIRRSRKGVGDRGIGDVVGAPGRARPGSRDSEGRSGPRRPLGRRCPRGCPLSHRCAPWCARLGVEGYPRECRRRRVQCRRGEWCERNGRWTSAIQARTIARHSLSRREWRCRNLVGAVDDV